jgi:hypothetical protein
MLSKVRETARTTDDHIPQQFTGNSRISSKLVLRKRLAFYVAGEQGYFIKGLDRELDVQITLRDDHSIKDLDKDDYIMVSLLHFCQTIATHLQRRLLLENS